MSTTSPLTEFQHSAVKGGFSTAKIEWHGGKNSKQYVLRMPSFWKPLEMCLFVNSHRTDIISFPNSLFQINYFSRIPSEQLKYFLALYIFAWELSLHPCLTVFKPNMHNPLLSSPPLHTLKCSPPSRGVLWCDQRKAPFHAIPRS